MNAPTTPTRAGDLYDPLAVLDPHRDDARVKWIALGLAIVVHAAVLSIHLPLRATAAPAARRGTITFVRRYVPPPPPVQRQRIAPKKTTYRLPIPDPTPDLPEPIEEPLPEIAVSEGDAPDLGVWIGTPEAPPGTAGIGAAAEHGRGVEPLLAGVGGVTNPVLIPESYVQPEFPEVARRARLDGNVVLRAIIERDGVVADPQVLRCTQPHVGFEESAIAAVRRWRYQPATQGGEPVAVYFTILVEFELL